MIRLKKFLRFLAIGIAALPWLACDEQPTDAKINYPYQPGQWYGYPTWSPTGEWIAYNYSGPSSLGIWLIRPDGSENHFLTEGITSDFSPDGKILALEYAQQIFIYELATKARTQLTHEGNNFFPSWSPDGKKIAFDSNFEDTKGANVIWTMDRNGKNKKDLSQHGIGEWRTPAWLPNFRILHIRYNRSAGDFFTMDSSGLEAMQIVHGGESNRHGRVSPDGNKIVWQRWDKATQEVAVWMMNADGGAQQRLTAGWEPAWAPDGRHIIYRKEGEFIPGQPWDDDDPKVHGSLWIMNIETRSVQQLLPRE